MKLGSNLSRGIVVLVVCGLGLVGMTLTVVTRPSNADYLVEAGALAFVLVAAVLVLRVPENRVSWLMLAIALGFGLMAWWAVIPNRTVAGIVNGIGLFGLVLPGMTVFVPLWFPTGRLPAEPWRWVGWVTGAGAVALLGGTAFVGLVEHGRTDFIGVCTTPGTCATFAGLLAILAMVPVAILAFITRWRRSTGVERQQLRWLVPAFLIMGIGAAAEFGGFQGSWVADVFFPLGVALIPVAISLAILRYRLYDIDRIISRTVSYALVVGLLGLVFVAGVVWIPSALDVGESPLHVAGSTLAVAALFNPVRRRIQVRVDRRFNRSRYDAERVVAGFAGSLQDRVNPDDIVDGWVGVVAETMQPTSMGVWVRQ